MGKRASRSDDTEFFLLQVHIPRALGRQIAHAAIDHDMSRAQMVEHIVRTWFDSFPVCDDDERARQVDGGASSEGDGE